MTGHGRWAAALVGVTVAAMGVGLSPAGAEVTQGDPSGGAAAAPVRYTAVDLGTLGENWAEAVAVNERGQVVGSSRIAGDTIHAFLWDPTTGMRHLGNLDEDCSYGNALNDRGQVAGSALTKSGVWHAFVWDPVAGMRDLGTLGGIGSEAGTISERGQVLGRYTTGRDSRAFVWDPVTGMRDLGLGDLAPTALSERGQVAGGSWTADGQRAFLWDPTTGMRDLGTLGGDSSVAGDVNERSQVVGVARAPSGVDHAFLWDPVTGMRDLGTLGGDTSWATRVNERGQVAGTARTTSGVNHAFLWDPVTGMRDLGTVGISGSVVGLNDRGQVAGTVETAPDEYHAFLWDPATGMRSLGTLGSKVVHAWALSERGQVAGVAVSSNRQSRRAVLWTPSSLAPRVSVTAARAGYGNQLHVNVNPNRGSEYWTFRVQKRTTSGSWTTLPGTHRTQGTAETRTLTLGAGVFRVTVDPRYGYTGATSAAVRLTRPTVKVAVRAVDQASRLFVDVDPNKGTGSWSFRVQKRTSSGSWTTLPTTYTTLGVKETRTINLRAGTYRVKVNPRYGYLGATSAAVRILR